MLKKPSKFEFWIKIYRLCFLPFLLFVLPYFLFRKWKRGGLTDHFFERLGCYPKAWKLKTRKRIWIQVVSVGELNAIGFLIEAIEKEIDREIILTTTTSTGLALAKKKYGDRIKVGLFPLDFWSCSAKAWKTIQPDVCLVVDSDLWPEHLHQAKNRQVPVVLVNGRLSDKSFGRYLYVQGFAALLLNQLSQVFAAGRENEERFKALGLAPEQLHCFPNLKWVFQSLSTPGEKKEKTKEEALDIPNNVNEASTNIDQDFSSIFSSPLPIVFGASTWPREEELLLSVQKDLFYQGYPFHLVLAPRHVERRNEVLNLLKHQVFYWSQRSVLSPRRPLPNLGEVRPEIFLLDSTGELRTFLSLADIVVMGKSFFKANRGGQNPLESATQAKAICYGPYMENFRDVCQELENAKGALSIKDEAQLRILLREWLMVPEQRKTVAHNAYQCCLEQQRKLNLFWSAVKRFL